jgi:hypothetical protein
MEYMIGKIQQSLTTSQPFSMYKYTLTFIRYLVVFTSIIYILVSCNDPYRGLYGHWKIYKTTQLNGITSLNQATKEQLTQYLLGKEIILAKDYILIF